MHSSPKSWNRTPVKVTFLHGTPEPEAKRKSSIATLIDAVGLPAVVCFILAALVALYLFGGWRVLMAGSATQVERDGGVVVERPEITSGDPE